MNILNKEWVTPFELPSFGSIREEDFLPALEEAIIFTKENIKRIQENTESPNFTNTIEALESSDIMLSRLTALFFNLASANSNSKLESIQGEFVIKLSKLDSEILMNKTIFKRLDNFYQLRSAYNLNSEQIRVLELYRQKFLRSGVRLSKPKKERLTDIMSKLSELGTKFSQNILSEERDWEMVLTKKDLGGLPSDLISILKQSGIDRNQVMPTLTLSRSHLIPFLENSSRRDLREKAYKAWVSRGANKNKNNNFSIINEILGLRNERAILLGYKNFASFKLETEMASNEETVKSFLKSVWEPAKLKALHEYKELQDLIRQDDAGMRLLPWDRRYYQAKLQKQLFNFNSMELKPYFKLHAIIEAAFYVAKKLFNLDFFSLSFLAYHPDVKTWEVKRNGAHIGIFMGDYFARESKRSGAWCSSFRSQSKFPKIISPVTINVCNFAKPTKGSDALLTFDDATTLFHEFGHALHNLLSNVTYEMVSGTSVARDFVELPSQLYEHWLSTNDVLSKFAIHSETNEKISQTMLAKLVDYNNFGSGFETVEYLSSAIVDIEIHTLEPSMTPLESQNKILKLIGMPEGIDMRHALSNFSHIFSGDGYSSGYYSYLWSEVMDADAFEAFKEKKDFFDRELSKKLELYIYSAGGSKPPEKLYLLFRGREANIDALLKGRALL